MKLEGIIMEETSLLDFRDMELIKKNIEKLPEDTINKLVSKNGETYLKTMINRRGSATILQFLKKEDYSLHIPEEAKEIYHNLKDEAGITFTYQDTSYIFLYPK
ncbi:MAG: hypothetical protein Q8O84_03785 [Nanoarchaeota archaeon]|nr:hypothetical protein [Nanoarchaeota archaeon]